MQDAAPLTGGVVGPGRSHCELGFISGGRPQPPKAFAQSDRPRWTRRSTGCAGWGRAKCTSPGCAPRAPPRALTAPSPTATNRKNQRSLLQQHCIALTNAAEEADRHRRALAMAQGDSKKHREALRKAQAAAARHRVAIHAIRQEIDRMQLAKMRLNKMGAKKRR